MRLIYKDGHLSRIENANHFIELQRHDDGKITSAQDDQDRQIHYHYDPKGRLIEADDLGNAPWRYSYTENDKLRAAFDPMQRLNFEISYDDAGRVSRLKQPSGVTQYRYDAMRRSTTVADRKDFVSRYFQNEEGITVRVVNPLSEETAIHLDDARNVVSLSRNGSVVEGMEYDEQHRVVIRHSATPTGPVDSRYKYDPASGALAEIDTSSSPSRTFTYDGNGNMKSAVTDDGLHLYEFSSAGDLTKYSAPEVGLSFAPDSDGLISAMKETKDATGLAYRAGGELAEIRFADGSRVKYEYQASGLRAELVYNDGRRIRYDYDSAGNLLSTKIFDAKGKQVQGQELSLNDSYQVVKRRLFDKTEEQGNRMNINPNQEVEHGKHRWLRQSDV